jgi:hypothetical protein
LNNGHERERSRKAWHALLAPLPDDVVPHRQPVGTPEILASDHGGAIAGWEQLTIDLSAGVEGLRAVLVVLDPNGKPISASDTVLHRIESPQGSADRPAYIHQESIGGRIDSDGTFRGTCWQADAPEPPDGEDARWDMKRSEPTASQVDALFALVAEVVRRRPPTADGRLAK